MSDRSYTVTLTVGEYDALRGKIAQLEAALQSLLPGLVLDLRYADADDDRDAMQSRIDTVMDCFTPHRKTR